MLVDGKWLPTFPNARYLFGRKEFDHWSKAPEGPDRTVQMDSVRPILDANLAYLVAMDHKIMSEVYLEPTPGHTPGHVSVRISSKGEEAMITGDLMHHPVQCIKPDWAARFDVDPGAARRTRRAFLERRAGKPVLVLGTHFATPTAGRVARDGNLFRFSAQET